MTNKPLSYPCGGADYATCCGRYHNGTPAPDAASMMRSRYSAYALKLEAYLLATWHSGTRPDALNLAADNTKWMGLEIKSHLSESANRATVEFNARHKNGGGRGGRLQEVSHFVCEDGQWFYVDGKFIEPTQ